MKIAAIILLGLSALGAVVVGPTALAAATAPPDVTEPVQAAGLAEEIRSRFWSAIDLPLPPIRTAIREYEQYPSSSFLIRVEVFDVLSGPTPRQALVLAVCWPIRHSFAGGWLDSASAETEIRRQFAESVAAGCQGAS